MDRPRGRIIELIPGSVPRCAVVEVVTTVTCPRCASGRGCGAGLTGGNGVPRRVDAVLPAHLEVGDGDDVWLEFPSQNLLRAALIVYGLPLAGMLVVAGGTYLAGSSDLQAVAATLLAGLGGVATGRAYLQRRGCLRRFMPRVTGCPAGESG